MVTQKKQLQEEYAPKVKIGESRQIVIPKKLYDRLNLVPGDYLEVTLRSERLVLTPQMFIERQLAEGLDDIKHGRFVGPFKAVKQAVRSLRGKE